MVSVQIPYAIKWLFVCSFHNETLLTNSSNIIALTVQGKLGCKWLIDMSWYNFTKNSIFFLIKKLCVHFVEKLEKTERYKEYILPLILTPQNKHS